ncbi:MAG TPA: metalloregulator ArsR/SmtB family transcription factor [Planctomycetota bacterium]|nr:metalloregulator ArsR/SmtB family transcription factor [Planctomycetota bacterium]
MNEHAALFRLLGDEARLRILHALSREALNVSELVEVLGIVQSGVSRHLQLLKSGGLLDEERQAGWSYYRARPETATNGAVALILEELRAKGAFRDDEARMKEVLRTRSERRPPPPGRHIVPGRSWAAWARGLGLLLPKWRVADLGCGSGQLALEIASWADWVVGIDRDAEVLKKARSRARVRGAGNVRWREGSVERVPLPDRAVDLALLSQVLHCVDDPAVALAEARRILVPGGRILVLELRAHKETWVVPRLGHVRLGFVPSELRRLLKDAGFRGVRIRHGDGKRGDPFRVLVADGRVPNTKAKRDH